MVPVPGGTFLMGSPAGEAGPRARTKARSSRSRVGAFWMGRHEVTWNEYDLFAFARRARGAVRRLRRRREPTP